MDPFPGFENLDGRLHGLQLRARLLLDPRLLLHARQRLLQALEVREDQFRGDRVDVSGRIHLPVDVRHVDVLEDAGHLTDGVSLTDVGEERVAHALALRRPPDDARDVHETHSGGHDALRVEDLRQHRQPGIRHPHHADVRFDRRERIVGRQHVVAGQRVEQGRLAGVREADDPNGESHERRVYGTPPLEGAASCRQKYLRTSCVSQILWVRVSSVNDTVGHRCSGPPLRALPQALGRPAAPAFFSPWAGLQAGLHTVSRGSAGVSADPMPLRGTAVGVGTKTAAGWFRHDRLADARWSAQPTSTGMVSTHHTRRRS